MLPVAADGDWIRGPFNLVDLRLSSLLASATMQHAYKGIVRRPASVATAAHDICAFRHLTLASAMSACLADRSCGGVTKDHVGVRCSGEMALFELRGSRIVCGRVEASWLLKRHGVQSVTSNAFERASSARSPLSILGGTAALESALFRDVCIESQEPSRAERAPGSSCELSGPERSLRIDRKITVYHWAADLTCEQATPPS
jgi:hypothetical protein